jgi:SAM-dependent methyltransferase
MAQDLRRLAVDNAPTKNMYATNIVSDFWDIGSDLFRDRSTLKTYFVRADILDADSALNLVDDVTDVVYAGSVLHLFGWQKHVQACKRIVRTSCIDTMTVECQMGRAVREAVEAKWRDGSNVYYHNVDNVERLWRQIGEKIDSSWRVKAKLSNLKTLGLEKEDIAYMRPGNMLLQFVVTCRADPKKLRTSRSEKI